MNAVIEVVDNILEAIGRTRMVRLTRLFEDSGLEVYAKFEGTNPGGSLKDRAAYSMIRKALREGLIRPGSTIIESSSGNMGIGLAQVCAYHKLRLICVVDLKTTAQNIAILKAFGAEVDMVTAPDVVTGEFLPVRIARVKELVNQIPNSFWPDQYSNTANADAHFYTMGEIAAALNDRVDYVFCAVSTCGTIAGCRAYIEQYGLHTRLWAVDAVGSVLFGGHECKRKRLIPGHGASKVPRLYRPSLADAHVHVTDIDCVRGCRRLVEQEAILAGGSSGAIVSAVDKVRDRIKSGSTCVLLLPDRGERYLDTVYSDKWVREQFGENSLMDTKVLAQGAGVVAL